MAQIKLYMYGCSTCGVNAVYVRQLRAACLAAGIDVVVKNTKYDKDALAEHSQYLQNMQLDDHDTYPAVVVEDDRVELLQKWQLWS